MDLLLVNLHVFEKYFYVSVLLWDQEKSVEDIL